MGREDESDVKREDGATSKGGEFLGEEMFSLLGLEQEHVDTIVKCVSGGAENVQAIYPLSALQEGILFHHLLNEQRDTYVLSTLLELQSRSLVRELIEALQAVINRHEILRSAVIWEGLPRPVQVLCREARLPVEEVTLEDDHDPIGQLKERMRPGRQKVDLLLAPLVRLQLFTFGRGSLCFALLQVHHLVCDHQSFKLVVAEALTGMAQSEVPARAPLPYRDYLEDAPADVPKEQAEAYFRRKIGHIDEPTAPFGVLDIHGDGSQLSEVRAPLADAIAKQVRTQAQRTGASPARLFHAAWGLVVARTSGRDEVVYGTVVLARRRRGGGAQRVLGMHVNTLPLRLDLRRQTANEFVEQTHRELTELVNYEQIPLTLAQRCSGIEGSAPLFTALLNYRHKVSRPEMAHRGHAGIRVVEEGEAWANYPLALTIDDLGGEFMLTAQADGRIDPRRVIEYVNVAMQALLDALDQQSSTPVLELAILPESERRQVVELFNATHAAYPRNSLIHELIEEQVRRTPEAVAVECGGDKLTYAKLNQRANQLAHMLVAKGVEPDQRVGVFIDRSVELVIALLGILKAGGAYVPLDVKYPVERVNHILADSLPVAVLTLDRLKGCLPGSACVIALDTDQQEIEHRSDENLGRDLVGLRPTHLAYVIYTSGSTGVPKGVMIEHRNFENLIHWHCIETGLSEKCRSSCVAAVGFDAASWEIWPPLCVGATLVMATSELVQDAEAFLAWWAREPLDISFLPTPMAELMFSRNMHNPRLRMLLVGGDRLSCLPVAPSYLVINNYGPTESTVVATAGRVGEGNGVLHIGRPIANTQVYILDEYLCPVAVGVAGEMYIAGAGVGRGYWNRSDLEAQRFIADRFGAEPRGRMYRTGDLAKWRADGTIEFLGRNDEQVKVRGYRIELGEIESRLSSHAQVGEAVVAACENPPGVKRLVAYFTRCGDTTPSNENLRKWLKFALPEYMIPNAFLMLDRFPLTPHGKVDRRRLPQPTPDACEGQQYEAPQGDVERILAGIWEELLGVMRVGRHDSFFELGGHSLLVMKAMMRIRSALAVELPIGVMFEYATLEALAAHIEAVRPTSVLYGVAQAGTRFEELLESVASMSESDAKELVAKLTAEGRL